MEREQYYLGAYWGKRKESAEECASKLQQFLHCPLFTDAGYIHWYTTVIPTTLKRLITSGYV
jgi:hypothetical protein